MGIKLCNTFNFPLDIIRHRVKNRSPYSELACLPLQSGLLKKINSFYYLQEEHDLGDRALQIHTEIWDGSMQGRKEVKGRNNALIE